MEQRRVATKAHSGADFNHDNAELYRILNTEFNGTMLQDAMMHRGPIAKPPMNFEVNAFLGALT